MPESADWRDGFLFLANQLSLDFLNTRPVLDGVETEFLDSPKRFAEWLAAARLISRADSARLAQEWTNASLNDLREFRELFRRTVLKFEHGVPPAAAFVRRLNDLLYAHPQMLQIKTRPATRSSAAACESVILFQPKRPQDAFASLAASVASLLTEAAWTKIRKCPNCVLHFYDVSKKGTRRWCSMNMCGNRAKVAAYAERKKSADMEG